MVQAEHKRGENQRACTPQTSYLPQASVHGSAKEKLFRKRNNASAAEKKRRKRKRRPGRRQLPFAPADMASADKEPEDIVPEKPSLSRKISPLPPRQQQMPRATKAIRSKKLPISSLRKSRRRSGALPSSSSLPYCLQKSPETASPAAALAQRTAALRFKEAAPVQPSELPQGFLPGREAPAL